VPIYEYKCKECGFVDEILMKFSDPDPEHCTKCGGGVEKLLSQTSFALKGGGWYVTDYKPQGSNAKAESSGTEAKAEGALSSENPAATSANGATAGSESSQSSAQGSLQKTSETSSATSPVKPSESKT
jgi:putative FmdB family regulatory protein